METIAVIVRKKLPEWEQWEKSEDYNNKMNFIIKEDFDDLTDIQAQLVGYHAFFCTLGTRQNTGKENFKKVDF